MCYTLRCNAKAQLHRDVCRDSRFSQAPRQRHSSYSYGMALVALYRGCAVGCADGPVALLRPAANDRMALEAWPGTCEDAYKDLRTGMPEGQDVQDVGRRESWIHSRTGAGVGRPEVTPVVGRSHPDSHPDSRPGSRAHRQAPAAIVSPMRRTSIRRGSARAECIRRRNPMRRRTATHARFGSWSQSSSGHIPVPASRR